MQKVSINCAAERSDLLSRGGLYSGAPRWLPSRAWAAGQRPGRDTCQQGGAGRCSDNC